MREPYIALDHAKRERIREVWQAVDPDDWAAQISARLAAERETPLDRLLRIPGRIEAALGAVLGGALLLVPVGRALRP